MLLFIQMVCSFESTAVVRAILTITSGYEPLSEIIDSRYIKLLNVSKDIPLTLISEEITLGAVHHMLIILSLIFLPYAETALSRC